MKYSVDELCTITNGGAWKQNEYTSAGIKVIKVSNLINDGIDDSNLSYLPQEALQKYEKNLLQGHDLVVTTVGSHPQLKESAAGRAFIISKDFEGSLLNQNAICIRSKNKDLLDGRYLGYLGKTDSFRHYIQQGGRGAANQMRIALSVIKKYTFDLPPLSTQKKIASILSAYDDLIENNLKRIQLLEEAAQQLYKEWFVNFRFPGSDTVVMDEETGLPMGWKKTSVGKSLAKLKRKGKLKKGDYSEKGEFPVIDQGNDLIGGYTNKEELVNTQPLPMIVFGDHTRRVKYIDFPFVSGADGTQLMYPENENMSPGYFYLAIKNIDLSNYAYARHFKFLKEEELVIPEENILKQFNKKVFPLLQQISGLNNYNIKLKEARDLLLPRLMNRTIEV